MYFFSSLLSWSLVKGVLGFLSALCFLRVHLRGSWGGRLGAAMSGCSRCRRKGGMWGKSEAGGNTEARGGDTGRGEQLGDKEGDGEERAEPGEVEPKRTQGCMSLLAPSLLSPALHFSDRMKSIPKDKTLVFSMTDDAVHWSAAGG